MIFMCGTWERRIKHVVYGGFALAILCMPAFIGLDWVSEPYAVLCLGSFYSVLYCAGGWLGARTCLPALNSPLFVLTPLTRWRSLCQGAAQQWSFLAAAFVGVPLIFLAAACIPGLSHLNPLPPLLVAQGLVYYFALAMSQVAEQATGKRRAGWLLFPGRFMSYLAVVGLALGFLVLCLLGDVVFHLDLHAIAASVFAWLLGQGWLSCILIFLGAPIAAFALSASGYLPVEACGAYLAIMALVGFSESRRTLAWLKSEPDRSDAEPYLAWLEGAAEDKDTDTDQHQEPPLEQIEAALLPYAPELSPEVQAMRHSEWAEKRLVLCDETVDETASGRIARWNWFAFPALCVVYWAGRGTSFVPQIVLALALIAGFGTVFTSILPMGNCIAFSPLLPLRWLHLLLALVRMWARRRLLPAIGYSVLFAAALGRGPGYGAAAFCYLHILLIHFVLLMVLFDEPTGWRFWAGVYGFLVYMASALIPLLYCMVLGDTLWDAEAYHNIYLPGWPWLITVPAAAAIVSFLLAVIILIHTHGHRMGYASAKTRR